MFSKLHYWALLNRLFSNQRIPFVPPIFHENKNVADLKKKKKKSELFNLFSAKQYSLISNSSELPLKFHYTTEKRLDALNFSINDVEKIMQN